MSRKMKTEYGRISMCLGVTVVFASCANAQEFFPKAGPPFELPTGIEELLKIDPSERNLVVGSPEPVATGATIGAPEYEPIESLVSIEAQMILLAKTKSGARVFVPQHLSPNFFARLFGGTIIPTRDVVAPSSE